MTLTRYLVNDLTKLHELISTIDDAQFVRSLKVLSNSTIGQHVRHILEFYLTLTAANAEVLSYDNRKRDRQIETNRQRCKEVIGHIIDKIEFLDEGRESTVVTNYGSENNEVIRMKSTAGREAGYVLEHSIHHQAMIKIGLIELGWESVPDIGVAPATVRARVSGS